MSDIKKGIRFSPSLCVTHSCNLDCVYCYQNHDGKNRMSLDTAKKAVDWIFNNIPKDMHGVEVSFIGGEPLIEFDLIRQLYEYTHEKYDREDYIFYATTNGTLLNDEMKKWFIDHKETFVLGLSLDGLPETHNKNRSNSFDLIDTKFFLETWHNQGIKMTLSEESLKNLADNVIFLHKLGFKEIDGVNLFEGSFDWSEEKYIAQIIPELRKLVDFYVENSDLVIDQMLGRQIDMCEESNRPKRKWCGIGTGAIFFDTDGTRLPCPFVTPMTFSKEELADIMQTNFSDNDSFEYKSPIFNPILAILSVYVGPIPFFVVPILPFPATLSEYPSTSVCHGIVIEAKGLIFKFDTSIPSFINPCTSSSKYSGNTTVPGPIKQILFSYKIPDGIKWNLKVLLCATTV